MKIRFSHEYLKMPTINEMPPKRALLLDCIQVEKDRLSKEFTEYDTAYLDLEQQDIQYYKLPAGRLILLLLKSGDHLWTTIRRFTEEKWGYYRSNIGQEFEIVIGNEEEHQ